MTRHEQSCHSLELAPTRSQIASPQMPRITVQLLTVSKASNSGAGRYGAPIRNVRGAVPAMKSPTSQPQPCPRAILARTHRAQPELSGGTINLWILTARAGLVRRVGRAHAVKSSDRASKLHHPLVDYVPFQTSQA